MNFKNIQIIISFLVISKSILSSPVYNEEDTEFSEEFSITEGLENSDIDSSYEIPDENDFDENLCLSSECATNSNNILSKLDTNVDPCDDFYQFSCGKWMENTIIPDNKSGISNWSIIANENLEIISNIMEGDYYFKGNKNLTEEQQVLDEKNFGKLKNFYNSCMDTNTINSKGIEPLINLIEKLEINKNKDSYKTADGLANLMAKLSSYNIPYIINLNVDNDFINSEKKTVRIEQSELILPTSYYGIEEYVNFYSIIIKDMFNIIFGNNSERDFEKLSYSIVELEKKIANILMQQGYVMFDLDSVNITTIESLNEKYPFINWNTFIGNAFSAANIHNVINDNSEVNVMNVAYFEALNDIFKETDADTLSAYAEYLVIKHYIDFIGGDSKQELNQYINQMGGSILNQRSEYCANILYPINELPLGNTVGSSMDMAISKFYIDKVFNDDSKHIGEDIVKNIKESMKNRISQITWLDDKTKEYAIEKVDAIIDKIAYPDYIMNPEYIDEQYKDLEIVSNDFFTNIVNTAKFYRSKLLKEAYKPNDRTKWIIPPIFGDAFYYELINDINIPAGFFKSPFFSSSETDYLNYGAIGMIMGHEVTHAFDNVGKNYDSKGGYKNWWSDSSNIEFKKLSQCFIDQYGSYSLQDVEGNEHYVNGNLTLAENLADNSGLSRAFEAYKSSLNKSDAKKRNQSLPGLTQYTNDQLFFVSFAQVWCIKLRPEIYANQVNSSHSPAKYRVNGSVSNSKYFAETFNCKAGSPMNPEKKCLLW